MATRLQERIERLRQRRTDPESGVVITKRAALRKALSAFPTATDALEYISDSADPVEPTYTAKSISERSRIEAFLGPALKAKGRNVAFAYQGSLSNDTHIKVHSDIDLLVVATHFFTVVPPLTATNPFTLDPVVELEQLRSTCATLLDNRFYRATVDVAGAMCISIKDGSLSRKVDVVPANWIHTKAYQDDTGSNYHLGVNVLDARKRTRVKNFPFAHNAEIDLRDQQTGGTFRRLVRLVKSIRSDADDPADISSYDIVGLCHAIDPTQLVGTTDVGALRVFRSVTDRFLRTPDLWTTLKVPNGTRLLFGDDGVSVIELSKFTEEVDALLMATAK